MKAVTRLEGRGVRDVQRNDLQPLLGVRLRQRLQPRSLVNIARRCYDPRPALCYLHSSFYGAMDSPLSRR